MDSGSLESFHRFEPLSVHRSVVRHIFSSSASVVGVAVAVEVVVEERAPTISPTLSSMFVSGVAGWGMDHWIYYISATKNYRSGERALKTGSRASEVWQLGTLAR